MTSNLENIDKEKGPFKAHFDQVLDSFILERTVYHSGALIRNNVNKLTKLENIKKLCNVFKPRKIVFSGGSKKTFGSHELPQLLRTRFSKFSDCYQYGEQEIMSSRGA